MFSSFHGRLTECGVTDEKDISGKTYVMSGQGMYLSSWYQIYVHVEIHVKCLITNNKTQLI